ncbi:hypothetical protein NBO_54g0009 [Nosema bombycis CQ1]|uniref:Uncharacterized protein n=1 Tax=Nosema bombycis (strain CQ1 / CVCC 102059) TaxID=578461 RepID=R0MM07_NOSB1|nr:hypothetical protein NBO_54g0009 [Nosema bombycis CQ1]|eukprot:EOB13863.1 hypothetical protein NBO_54g0009 [Nosema bombycis CQ1]
MYVICGLGVYLLFFGIATSKISLSLILTYSINYYLDAFAKAYQNVSSSGLKGYFAKNAYYLASAIQDKIENDTFLMFLLSSFISCVFIFLAGGATYLMGFIGVYLFYTTYVDYFIDDEYIVKVFFFIIIVLVFMSILMVFKKALKFLLVILFSLTGSIIFLVSAEHIFSLKLGINEMVKQMGHNFDLTLDPQGVGFVGTLFIIGVVIQMFFVPSLPYL